MANLRLLPLATLLAGIFLAAPAPLAAQIPQLLAYQGRVAVAGVNFSGTGQFRFALVNAAGTTTFWSNDGTSTAGAQPTSAVSLTVSAGLYAVNLGDTALANMTAIPATVFDQSDVRLRVWFNDGVNGSQWLTPDQRIAAVGYAVIAGNVPDGAITAAKLAPGAIGSGQLAPGAAAANLAASGQAGVASGGTILGNSANNPALTGAGYLYLGAVNLPDSWTARVGTNAPSARYRHSCVWTGTEMIIWGGIASGTGLTPTYLTDGARYHPTTDTWTAISGVNAPAGRATNTVVWTGTEMIVWGGANGTSAALATGSRYNPTTNTWTSVNPTGAPGGRRFHTAVWTGSEMIVWGGLGTSTVLGDGSRYNPTTNSWSALTNVGAATARMYHSAVWTGTEMIVWGGTTTGALGGAVADGARYNRTTNSWTPTNAFFTPTARILHTAVWSGTDMFIWGGVGSSGVNLNDGARYVPTANAWNPLPTANAPSKRDTAPGVWSGSAFIVWGGEGGGGVPPTDGGQFNPATNTWTATTPVSAAPSRVYHSQIWTGSEMLTFGGITDPASNTPVAFNDVWAFTPTRTMYLYSKP